MTDDRAPAPDAASPTVELIYDAACPNVDRCRTALDAGMRAAGLLPSWAEWERSDPRTPAAYRHYGSPTVLVNGRDIAAAPGSAPPAGNSCRVYVDDAMGSLSGVPPVQSITRAITRALTTSQGAE